MTVQYKLIIFQYIKYKNPPMNQIFFFNPNFPLQHPPPSPLPKKKPLASPLSFCLLKLQLSTPKHSLVYLK